MTPPPATVFVVEDDTFMRRVLRGILRSAGHAVEAFERAEPLLSRLTALDRGCVVIALKLPGLDGLELHRALHERGLALPTVFVSGKASVAEAVAAMKQGAVDFLTKPVNPAELVRAVGDAVRRDARGAAEREARDRARARWELLTPRERKVCRLIHAGLQNKQVAAELGVSVATAHAQRSSAFRRLGVGSLVELIRLLDRLDGSEPAGRHDHAHASI